MPQAITCKKCGAPFGFMALLNAFPARIRCRNCKTLHHYNRGYIFALVFYLCWLACVLLLFRFSSNFDIQHNDNYMHSLLTYAVFIGGAMLSTLILGLLYIWSLERWSSLEIKEK